MHIRTVCTCLLLVIRCGKSGSNGSCWTYSRHTVFQAGKLLIIGDLIHGAALQLEHPEICATYDMDKQEAIKTRKNLLQYARENGLVIAGMHLPVPAFIK